MDKKLLNASPSFKSWEIWGILFILSLGTLLHFTFEFSGYWFPVGIFSAVNESVWEHLKMAFWPALFWTLIEYLAVRPKAQMAPNFFLAKAIGAFLMLAIIVSVFYTYTPFVIESILAVDISSYFVAVIIGQLVSLKLIGVLKLSGRFNQLGLILFAIGVLCFALFTFFPPHAGIFMDSNSLTYGIP
jgi:hypothetical protein